MLQNISCKVLDLLQQMQIWNYIRMLKWIAVVRSYVFVEYMSAVCRLW
jgi:hypothetical protein